MKTINKESRLERDALIKKIEERESYFSSELSEKATEFEEKESEFEKKVRNRSSQC